jgi:tRNA splicing ligase
MVGDLSGRASRIITIISFSKFFNLTMISFGNIDNLSSFSQSPYTRNEVRTEPKGKILS